MIYVFLADGFEEIEALTPVDYLRRCELDVKTVGVGSQAIKSSRGVTVLADIDDAQIVLDDNLKMIVLPGGMPATINLEKNSNVINAIDYCIEKNIYIGAICAAPSILGHKNLLDGIKATCFPGFEQQLGKAIISSDIVCHDKNIITAKGVGVSNQFTFKLVEVLLGKKEAEKLEATLQCK